MPRYNLRNHNSPKTSVQDVKASPQAKKRSPRSPNASGYSSSHSHSHLDYDDDNITDSQDEESQDEIDFSYPSTAFSPSAATPSPSQFPYKRKVTGTPDSDVSPYSPSTRHPLHQEPTKSSESDTSPTVKRGLYPDLTTLEPEKRGFSPNTRKKTTSKEKEEKGSDYTLCITAAVGIALFILFVTCFTSGNSSEKKKSLSNEFQRFVLEVDKLKNVFKSQEPRTWRTIKSSVKHILNGTDPEYPAVVMFAVRKDISAIGSCFARRVASLFNRITEEIIDDGYFDARLMSHLEAGKQKEYLDDKIHSNLKSGRSVVIDHLEALSPSASLLLHGTCDNDNAPFKNVFIGIVLNVDENLKAVDVDTALTTYFLKELDMDKIGALLTRINNNAIVIKDENEFDTTQCS